MPTNRPPDADLERIRQGETIRTIRELRGLKVGDLANLIKPPISYAYLSNIEAGRKRLTPQMLARIALALNVKQASILHPDQFKPESAA